MTTFIHPEVTRARKDGIMRNVTVGFILILKNIRNIMAKEA